MPEDEHAGYEDDNNEYMIFTQAVVCEHFLEYPLIGAKQPKIKSTRYLREGVLQTLSVQDRNDTDAAKLK